MEPQNRSFKGCRGRKKRCSRFGSHRASLPLGRGGGSPGTKESRNRQVAPPNRAQGEEPRTVPPGSRRPDRSPALSEPSPFTPPLHPPSGNLGADRRSAPQAGRPEASARAPRGAPARAQPRQAARSCALREALPDVSARDRWHCWQRGCGPAAHPRDDRLLPGAALPFSELPRASESSGSQEHEQSVTGGGSQQSSVVRRDPGGETPAQPHRRRLTGARANAEAGSRARGAGLRL